MALHPTILETDGKPAFVVLPYDEYLALVGTHTRLSTSHIPADGTIPHEVVERMTSNGWSLVRAWREYLGITQRDIAGRLEIRQPTYVRMENPEARLRRSTRVRIARALGVSLDQLGG